MSIDVVSISSETTLGTLLDAGLPAQLAALEALTDAISSADQQEERDRHSGTALGEASVRVHQACARLNGKRYDWLNAEEGDGIWATSEFRPRTFASHVARTHRISYRNASSTVRIAHQLRDDIPEFGRALRGGAIGPDHVHALASTALTSAARIAALTEQVTAEEPAEDPDKSQTGAADSEGVESPGDDDVEGTAVEGTAVEGTEHTGAREAPPESFTVEQYLLEQARQLRPDQVRRLGQHFARVADPEADDRGYRHAKEREYLELVRTLDGWHLSGFLSEENGRLVRTALNAVTQPPSATDARTGDQRRAQALADVAHVLLDRGLTGTNASVRPHVGVLITPTDMERLVGQAEIPADMGPASGRTGTAPNARSGKNGQDTYPEHRERLGKQREPEQRAGLQEEPAPVADSSFPDTPDVDAASSPSPPPSTALDWRRLLQNSPPTWADGTGPVPESVLRRLSSCGDLYRILFSPESEVLNLGRAYRTFTPAQRRALVARDQGCTWPGCTAPPSLCESHHARVHWADGGATNISNGALLCYHHHSVVDDRCIEMTRRDGVWIFTRSDGAIINTDCFPAHERNGWPSAG